MMFNINELNSLFSDMKEGILIADKNGNIVYFNNSYSKFIRENLDNVKGKPLTDLRPGARLPEVLYTGLQVNNIIRKEWEDEYFCNIYPIYSEGNLQGAISIVTFLTDAKKINFKLKELEEKSKLLSKRMQDTNGTNYSFEDIITKSVEGSGVKNIAKRIAKQDIDVLIQGETGTGKELFAQSIHNASSRSNEPFIAINCSAFPKDILESELFGYEEGAFTGAKKNGKIGLFEAANKGTVFLDEISEMDLSLQAKLLRVIQERKIRKLGGVKEISIDVRIIYACNVDLRKYISEKKFREDLFYRISIIPLQIPSLRERRDDVVVLAENFLREMNFKLKRDIKFSPEALDLLVSYDWPGNIRELRNIVEFSALMTKEDEIKPYNLPEQIIKKEYELAKNQSLSEMTREYEKKVINDYINIYGSDLKSKKKIARLLNISLASLYKKI